MNKKALTNTTPIKELPLEMFKHIESFLHPLNALALRATNKMSASTINTHNQAKRYLQQKLEHKGLGNLFIKNTAMRFVRHIHTKPSDKQQNAIAQAIASDNSAQGREFMLAVMPYMTYNGKRRLPYVIDTGNSELARQLMYNYLDWIFIFYPKRMPTDNQRKAIAQAFASDNSEKGREFMYDIIKKIITYTRKDDSALFVLSPGSMTSVSRHPGPNRVNISGVWT